MRGKHEKMKIQNLKQKTATQEGKNKKSSIYAPSIAHQTNTMGKTKDVTPHQKTQILQKLLSSINKKGRLELGTINKLAIELQLCRKTKIRLWKEVQSQINSTKQ